MTAAAMFADGSVSPPPEDSPVLHDVHCAVLHLEQGEGFIVAVQIFPLLPYVLMDDELFDIASSRNDDICGMIPFIAILHHQINISETSRETSHYARLQECS